MRTLRYLLCWYFWILFVFTACTLVIREPRVLLNGIAADGASLPVKIEIGMAVAMIVAVSAFARAWWVLWHEQLPARVWCIVASVLSLMLPALILTLYALGSRHTDFWRTVGILMVPVAIGIGGILFGLTDAARSLPPAARPHLGRAILDSFFLLLFASNFVRIVVAYVLGFIRHKHLPVSYLVALAICGFLSWIWFRSLRRELRKRGIGMSEATTI